MVKTNKKEKNILILFKSIALLFFLYTLYYQLGKVPSESINIKEFKIFALLISILLTPINWYCEWKKWILTLNENELSNQNAAPSFYAGMVSSFLTPAIPGNFLGRIFYYAKEKRIELTTYIQISNLSQLLSSIIFGIIAIGLIGPIKEINVSNKHQYLLITIISLLIIFYFIFKRRISKLRSKYLSTRKSISIFFSKALLISIIRHLVFTLQFLFILICFGVEFNGELILWIWISYLAVTLTPSIIFGKIVIRDSITIAIFQLAGYEVYPILISTVFIWGINLLIPTIFAWKKIKLNRIQSA